MKIWKQIRAAIRRYKTDRALTRLERARERRGFDGKGQSVSFRRDQVLPS